MLGFFRKGLTKGIATEGYPECKAPPPAAFRGRHRFLAERCDGCQLCVPACPSEALAVDPPSSAAPLFRQDFSRCVFCTRCVEVCPPHALATGPDFELATTWKGDLLTASPYGAGAGAGAEAAAAEDTEAARLAREVGRRGHALFGRSLHIRHLAGGSCNGCDFEIMALLNPLYDVQRFGIDFVASPRHADMLLVTGPVTRNLEVAVRRTYEATPEPRLVVALGACACSGGMHQGSYATCDGVDQVLPVDMYIPGCPPRPEAILHSLLLALDRLPGAARGA